MGLAVKKTTEVHSASTVLPKESIVGLVGNKIGEKLVFIEAVRAKNVDFDFDFGVEGVMLRESDIEKLGDVAVFDTGEENGYSALILRKNSEGLLTEVQGLPHIIVMTDTYKNRKFFLDGVLGGTFILEGLKLADVNYDNTSDTSYDSKTLTLNYKELEPFLIEGVKEELRKKYKAWVY